MGCRNTSLRRRCCMPGAIIWQLVLACGVAVPGTLRAESYDPLQKPKSVAATVAELVVQDEERSREIPLKLYLPAAKAPAPLILFSHGLGGTRNGCSYLGVHWSARGYVVVALQHRGSDDGVWRDLRLGQRIVAMRRAGSPENLALRVGDVRRVLDQLTTWNTTPEHPLAGRLNLQQIGMSGHSFGAITAQVLGGEKFSEDGDRRDGRIRAVVALSPSIPHEEDPAIAFESVAIPWLMITGTKDVVTMFKTNLESRLGVYRNLPEKIDRYELVLYEAEHSAFTDIRMAWDRGERNPNHHRAVLAVSTAFWDFYLRGDAQAGDWLKRDRVRSVLEQKDAWQWAPAGSPVAQPDEQPDESPAAALKPLERRPD